MHLTPRTFECPIHHVDLTAEVRAALDGGRTSVAYASRPFRVLVQCPGDGPDSAHPCPCEGWYRR